MRIPFCDPTINRFSSARVPRPPRPREALPTAAAARPGTPTALPRPPPQGGMVLRDRRFLQQKGGGSGEGREVGRGARGASREPLPPGRRAPRGRRAGEGRRRGQPPAIDNPRARPRRRQPEAADRRARPAAPQRAVSALGTERKIAGCALGGSRARGEATGLQGSRFAWSRGWLPSGGRSLLRCCSRRARALGSRRPGVTASRLGWSRGPATVGGPPAGPGPGPGRAWGGTN